MDKTRLYDPMRDFFAQTRKNLLLFLEDTETLEKVQLQLRPCVTRLTICNSPQTALRKIRTTINRQILLEDCFSSQEILAEIAAWEGRTRRFTHLVLLGERGTSLNSQLAFTLGIDTYLHIQDIERLGTFFEQSQKTFLYRNRLWLGEGSDF